MKRPDKDKLRPAEVADWFGRPVSTIYSWVRRGVLPHVRIGPHSVLIDADELMAWLESRRAGPEMDTPRRCIPRDVSIT